MNGDVLLVLLILVLGCAAFIFGIVYAIGSGLACIGRGIAGLFRPRNRSGARRVFSGFGCCGSSRAGSASKAVARRRVCRNMRCRKVEYRDARFCSQCGAPLPDRDGSTGDSVQ